MEKWAWKKIPASAEVYSGDYASFLRFYAKLLIQREANHNRNFRTGCWYAQPHNFKPLVHAVNGEEV